MATTITNHGFDSQFSNHNVGPSSGFSFGLDEGINRIKFEYKQSTESSNWLYMRVYNNTAGTTTDRMRISYNSRLISGATATDYGNSSGTSATNELMWLNYFTSDSNASQIPHQVDITVLSVPCTSKISPYIFFEGNYGNTGGSGTYWICGGGKILRRASFSERPVLLSIFSNSGSTLTWSGNKHFESKVRLGA